MPQRPHRGRQHANQADHEADARPSRVPPAPPPHPPPLITTQRYHRLRDRAVGWTDPRLLREAGIRDGRLHDARHTASTVLLLLGVPERIVMAIMGWSSTSMAQRYQHVTEPMLNDVGKKIGGLLWGGEETASSETGN
ncbi:tyrosine-type recombinase/integrase [Kitasatospora sp. NPDC005856]|uniref:tyrosine-type recombinase/integrase n=1 Tax=Kitasatospora sp. NPDC005856 TaxID=3154566 RepID=UPI0033F54EF5